MDSVLDFLFLRRLKFEYVCPPICPVTPASASGTGIQGQVISPLLKMQAPTVSGRFLVWPCQATEICYNIYFNNGGVLTEVATCISPNSMLVCSTGYWTVIPLFGQTPGPETGPVYVSTPTTISLPAQPGVTGYEVYYSPDGSSSELVLAGEFCAAFETCTLGCYSLSAITGDGETPPSDPACNGGDPTISITSPTDGEAFDAPASFSVIAAVNMNGHTLNAVDFYDGTTLLGSVSGAGPYSVPFSSSEISSHTFTAVLHYDGALSLTSAPVTITVDVLLPALNDLLQQTESFDFDSTPDGTEVTLWLDKTPNHNNWTGAPGSSPKVSSTTAGGHKTLRFAGPAEAQGMQSTGIFIPNTLTSMELMVVYKADADPPLLAQNYRNPVITYQETLNNGPASTWADQGANSIIAGCGGPGPFYLETFCMDNTGGAIANCGPFLNVGTPATNAATQFVSYNVSAKTGGPYDVFLNSEHFFTQPAGLPFITQGIETFYTLGWGLSSNGSGSRFAGNIAAVYLWKRALTSTERDKARSYIAQKWGVTF